MSDKAKADWQRAKFLHEKVFDNYEDQVKYLQLLAIICTVVEPEDLEFVLKHYAKVITADINDKKANKSNEQ